MSVIAETPAGTVGDYNNNGKVDAADYTVWRNSVGQPGTVLKNRSPSVMGNVQQQDYAVWKANFGLPLGSGSGAAAGAPVPEPAAMVLCLIASVWAMCILRHHQ